MSKRKEKKIPVTAFSFKQFREYSDVIREALKNKVREILKEKPQLNATEVTNIIFKALTRTIRHLMEEIEEEKKRRH